MHDSLPVVLVCSSSPRILASSADLRLNERVVSGHLRACMPIRSIFGVYWNIAVGLVNVYLCHMSVLDPDIESTLLLSSLSHINRIGSPTP